MILYLVRHGIAEDQGSDGTDASRRLTARGRLRMREIGRGLSAYGVKPDVVCTSPLPRAADTATLVADALGVGPPRTVEALATGAAAPEVVRALAPFARHARVMVVGHEPTLSEVVALLCTGSAHGMAVRFKKGACVALELTSLAPPRGAVLRWAATPRQMRLRRSGR